jgi:hypothetical protein
LPVSFGTSIESQATFQPAHLFGVLTVGGVASVFNWYSTGNTLARIDRDTAGWRDLPLASLCCQLFYCVLFVKGLPPLFEATLGVEAGGEPLQSAFSLHPLFLGISTAGLRFSYIERSCYVALPFFLMVLAMPMPVKQNGWSLVL